MEPTAAEKGEAAIVTDYEDVYEHLEEEPESDVLEEDAAEPGESPKEQEVSEVPGAAPGDSVVPEAPLDEGGVPDAPPDEGEVPEAPPDEGEVPEAPPVEGEVSEAHLDQGGVPKAPLDHGEVPVTPPDEGEVSAAPIDESGVPEAPLDKGEVSPVEADTAEAGEEEKKVEGDGEESEKAASGGATEAKEEEGSLEEEVEVKVPTLPDKDYNVVDPSFLDEFDSSLEEIVRKEEVRVAEEEEVVEEQDVSSDEDKYAVYDLPSSIGTDVYVCGHSSEGSTYSDFSELALLARRKRESKEPPRTPPSVRLNEIAYLKSLANPDLIRGLAEVALYQPSRPTEYLSAYLRRAVLTREELGMDPDPRQIQELVDRHERMLEAERRRRKVGMVTGETSSATRSLSGKSSSKCGNLLKGVRDKYRSDMANIRSITSQRQKERIKQGGLGYKKYECLGPTTLVKGFLPRNTFN